MKLTIIITYKICYWLSTEISRIVKVHRRWGRKKYYTLLYGLRLLRVWVFKKKFYKIPYTKSKIVFKKQNNNVLNKFWYWYSCFILGFWGVFLGRYATTKEHRKFVLFLFLLKTFCNNVIAKVKSLYVLSFDFTYFLLVLSLVWFYITDLYAMGKY